MPGIAIGSEDPDADEAAMAETRGADNSLRLITYVEVWFGELIPRMPLFRESGSLRLEGYVRKQADLFA